MMRYNDASMLQNLEDARCEPILVKQCVMLNRENKTAFKKYLK